MTIPSRQFGLRANLAQVLQNLLQVLLVGMTIGMMRNVVPALADVAHPTWRASAIGLYRFWRDLGYGLGALGLGAAAALGGRIETAFSFVAVAMFLSGAVLWRWGEETPSESGR